MSELKITNKKELDKWLFSKVTGGGSVVAIKGNPPEGATYEDGEPLLNPINVGWRDVVSGEVFYISYELY